MIHRRIPFIAIVFGCIFLTGCAAKSTPISSTENQHTPQPDTPSTYPDAPFNKSTLYALMVAEIASQRDRLDITLGNYLEQAHITGDPGVAERSMRIAQYLGARQAVLESARLWAKSDPDNVQALQSYALEMAHAGHLNDSAIIMQRVLQLGGTTHFDLLALQAEEISPYERAALQATIDEILQLFPHNPQLMLAQAIMLEHAESYDAALGKLTQLINQYPNDEKALLHQGRLLHRLKRYEEAALQVQTALKNHPQNTRLRLLYAQILIDLNRLDEALAEFKLLHDSAPNDPDLILSIALTSLEGNLMDQAELHLNKLLLLEKRTSAAHYYLGRLSQLQDKWEAARDHYLQVDDESELLPAYTFLTRMLADHERWEEAHTYLQQAREHHPDLRVQLFILESEVLTEQREYDQAHTVLNEAIAIYPRNISLLYARAMLAEKSDDISQLEKDLRAILAINPDNAMALNALGYTLADRTDRYQEAAELISKALEFTPGDPAVIDSLGWVEFRLGNIDESLKLLRRAYQLYPDPEIAAHLIEVLWSMDEKNEAQQIWEQALEQNPDSDLLKAVMERLNPS